MTKILVVDDLEQNLYLLQAMLGGSGYEVMTAANGAEALQKARGDPPELIVTDILMPVMDGYALAREWMKDARLKQIPLVFYTATYTDPRDREFGLSLGAARFIIKPAEPEAFVAQVREVLANHRVGQLVPPAVAPVAEATFLQQYDATLVRKLEHKMQALEREIEQRKRAEEKTTQQLTELQRWYEATLGREERVMELKCEVNELLAELGRPSRYASVAEPAAGAPGPANE